MQSRLSRTVESLMILVLAIVVVNISGCGGNTSTPAPNTGNGTTPSANSGSTAGTPSAPMNPSQAAGTFTPTGNMAIARAAHWARLLPDGTVLIVGGKSCVLCASDPAENSAELYDPTTGQFTSTTVTFTTRGRHNALILPNGTVVIVGGIELQDGRTLITNEVNAEVYDPVTDTLVVAGAYVHPTPVTWTTGTLLMDGRVLITGCAEQCSVGVTELYDAKSGTFSSTGRMKGWFNENTATLLADGRILFVGNAENDGSPGEAEFYDPVPGTFTFIGNTNAPHEFSAAVRLLDGSVLIAGGQVPGGDGSSGADLYIPATGTFISAGYMNVGRHEHTATLLRDGSVLIAGGYSVWPIPTATAEIYKPPVAH